MKNKFSKRKAYQNTLDALNELLQENPNPEVVAKFQGFGGLKEILLPIDNRDVWSQEDLRYYAEVVSIHDLLRKFYGDAYKDALNSVKNSILTSFYTGDFIVKPLVKNAAKLFNGVDIEGILEPSAGSGNMVKELVDVFPGKPIVAIEKDILTAKVLKALHPTAEVVNSGYEDFKGRKFDLIISNIPFGNVSVYDGDFFKEKNPIKVKATTRIHNYFFVKALDNLYDGGVIVFITSSGVMDSPANKEIREFLVKKAHLVSAVRLPNTAFESAGTYPVTDVIVIKKDSTKLVLTERDQAFINTEKMGFDDESGIKQLDISRYYIQHPGQILGKIQLGSGQYGKDSIDVVSEDEEESLQAKLNERLGHDFANVNDLGIPLAIHNIGRSPAIKANPNLIPDDYPGREKLVEGNLIILNQRVGTVAMGAEGLIFKNVELGRELERVHGLIELRKAYSALLDAEFSGFVPDMDRCRAALNSLYDAFVFRFGALNNPTTKKILRLDPDGFKLAGIERLGDDGKIKKADIFFKQINNIQKKIDRPESLKDAVLLSLNEHNRIDIDFIAELIDTHPEQVIKKGLDDHLMFYDFKANGTFDIVSKDEFLSGNVVAKIQRFENLNGDYLGLSHEHIENHQNLLKEVQPAFLKLELIDVSLGERWVSNNIYQEFAGHLLKADSEVQYMRSQDRYVVRLKRSTDANEITWSARLYKGKLTGVELLEYAMLDVTPNLTKPGLTEGSRVPDVEGMKNCEIKIAEIRNEFAAFISNTPHVREWIENRYNEKFNNSVRRGYDGAHLVMKDLKHYVPYGDQKDATWMLLQRDGGIIDHVVGAGKTLVIIMAAHEMKRVGLNRKPMGIFLKANIDQAVAGYKKAYPNDKVLYPTEKDFTPANRKALFAQIASNDWDFIALTHDQFQKIPHSLAIQREVIEQELNNLEDDLKVVTEDKGLSKRLLKGLEVRKENLKNKINEINDSLTRDENILDFDKMGIDHLFVDESQQFKNLAFTTRHSDVSGLGSPDGSQRAFNLQLAARTLQKKKNGDRGITFLSGTTISNSLVELYLLFKYLRPSELDNLGITGFDAWAKMYARKTTNYEFTVTNEIKRKDRFREFVKVPELARFYAEIAHVVTSEMLKVKRPKVQHEVQNIDPTPAQEEFIQKLVAFARTKDGTLIGKGRLTKEEENAYMLIATNYAKKMSIDMRMIHPELPFEEDGKLGKLIANVVDEYQSSHAYKGTQLIFCDLGTPNGSGFNVYAEIRRLLAMNGIPEEEIQFIHDHNTKIKREKLFNAVNAGLVRIVIGSTTMMGTGVNMQERIITMHHIDIPWRPSDFEQRVGRGGRQGNIMAELHKNNIVRNIVYAVNRSLDGYQFNILSAKQKFISQIKNNSMDVRRIDEGSMDQESGMNFGEYVALLSGNADLLNKVKLEKQLSDLERSYTSFMQRQGAAKFEIERLTKQNLRDEQWSLKYQQDLNVFKDIDIEKCHIQFRGKSYDDRAALGKEMLIYFETICKDEKIGMGTIFEMSKVLGFTTYFKKGVGLYTETPAGNVLQYAKGELSPQPALAGRYILNAMNRIPSIIDTYKEARISNAGKIVTYGEELKKEFLEKDKIVDIKKQVQELSDKIEKAYQQPETPKVEQPSEVNEPKQEYKRSRGIKM
jgi:N12 class adenine-specific DNA methylase